jgi:hypothetical protein
MSMKRSKPVRSFGGSSAGLSDDPFTKAPVVEKTFAELTEGKEDDAFAPFDIGKRYEKGDLFLHAKFGKGVVTVVEGSKIEVLFADQKRKLGHAMS